MKIKANQPKHGYFIADPESKKILSNINSSEAEYWGYTLLVRFGWMIELHRLLCHVHNFNPTIYILYKGPKRIRVDKII